MDLPEKITPDAILEALVEIRFHSDVLPEQVVGTLLSAPPFKPFEKARLPQAEIPASARESDPNLRYLPFFQLQMDDGLLRFGPNTFSFHVLAPYCGWPAFEERAACTLRNCLDALDRPVIENVALRYINACTPQHHIASLADINLSVKIAEHELDQVAVNFTYRIDEVAEVITRVTSKEMVWGEIPGDASLVIDIEVRNASPERPQTLETIMDWLGRAHDIEKQQFFALIPQPILDHLKEK